MDHKIYINEHSIWIGVHCKISICNDKWDMTRVTIPSTYKYCLTFLQYPNLNNSGICWMLDAKLSVFCLAITFFVSPLIPPVVSQYVRVSHNYRLLQSELLLIYVSPSHHPHHSCWELNKNIGAIGEREMGCIAL